VQTCALPILYGTTAYGGSGGCSNNGATGCGTVFKLTFANDVWRKQTIYNFTGGSDGEFPSFGTLIRDCAGNLYGTTSGDSVGTFGSFLRSHPNLVFGEGRGSSASSHALRRARRAPCEG